jgi:hypothetical protein
MLVVGALALPLTMTGAGSSAVAAASAATGAPAGPAVGSKTEFYNWSGYGETGGTYSQVLGVWTVPDVKKTSGPTYSSSWIGIDGEFNRHLIQTGTEQDYYNGKAHYDAWWEILPAAETLIPSLTVSPGDLMSADIAHSSGTSWSISIVDNTTQQTFSITKNYTGPGASVEWIQEATTINGKVATLAKYGEVTFSNLEANSVNPQLTTSDEIFMVNKADKVISSPSAPSTAGDAFSVAYGNKSPPPPTG